MYIFFKLEYNYSSCCYSIFSIDFSIPSPQRVSYIIQLPLDNLGSPFVNRLSHYLNVCPIRHLSKPLVSCGSQDSTVQESSPHKCSQKSSYSAFNAVVTVFLQIFLSSHHPGTFMMHVPVPGASWKVTLIIRIHIGVVPSLSKEMFLLGSPSIHSLLMRLQTGITYNYLFLIGPSPRPNIHFRPLTLQYVFRNLTKTIQEPVQPYRLIS